MDERNILFAYAAYLNNEKIRMQSSSGAVFFIAANYILMQKGIVYGVAMSEDCKSAEFIRVDSFKMLPRLMGSKYIQAKAGNVFKQIKEDLLCGNYVLFTGTGCQINGLHLFLGKEYNNLFCIDVVCHGVPSPQLWKSYTDYIEKKNKAKIESVNFRSKYSGRKELESKTSGALNKQIFIPKGQDLYMKMFLNNYSLRPSCYECQAKKHRLSDISIADFWGIDQVVPEMNDNKGISLLILRTNKGCALFEKIASELTYKKVSYRDAIRENLAEYASVKRPTQRDAFYNDFRESGFDGLIKKYFPLTLKRRIKNVLLATPFRRIIDTRGEHVDGMLFVLARKNK